MNILYSLASTTLIITPLIFLLLLLTPFLDKKYAAHGRYWLWIMIMVGLCAPFFSFIPRPAIQIDIPIPLYMAASVESARSDQRPVVSGRQASNLKRNADNLPADSYENSNRMAEFPAITDMSAGRRESYAVGSEYADIENHTPIESAAIVKTPLKLPTIDMTKAILSIWTVGIFLALTYQGVDINIG